LNCGLQSQPAIDNGSSCLVYVRVQLFQLRHTVNDGLFGFLSFRK
jgi:hypothetical protein